MATCNEQHIDRLWRHRELHYSYIMMVSTWSMSCACISLEFKKKKGRIVSCDPSIQMFDARSINFISCSSCFAKNCNFTHEVNISLHNSQRKYKVKDAIHILDESMKMRPTASLPLSSLIIYAVHISSAVTTLHRHIRYSFIPRDLAQWKGESVHFKKEMGLA